MFVETLAHGQVAQLMAAQVQAVEVADGHLHALVPGVVGGGLVPVAVEGEAFIPGQFGQMFQPVGQRGGGQQGAVHIAGQVEAARAGVGVKVVGASGHGVKARAMFLEEGPSAHDGFEHALEAQAQPVFVGELQAGTMMRTGGGQAGEGLKEGVVHAG